MPDPQEPAPRHGHGAAPWDTGASTAPGTEGRPAVPGFEAYHPSQKSGPSPSKLLVIAVIASLALVGFGLMRGVLLGGSEARADKPAAHSADDQQAQMRRDATQMAREAQQMQGEHVQRLRGAMPREEGLAPDPEAGEVLITEPEE